MMQWQQLLSTTRLGMEDYKSKSIDARTEFQKDYDRLIFSTPFRRLQHKTQVFPLPSSIFVHNRLTHSLEVASVGRSLGDIVASKLKAKYPNFNQIQEIGSIVSAACLAHDLGNPPFGHSGEDAISSFFKEGEGLCLQNKVSKSEWADLTCFEGNANALRLLSHAFNGFRTGGYSLTYSTLASIVKYPYSSKDKGTKNKYGFFCSEKETYTQIAKELGLQTKDGLFVRHPLVYLVEAADDICYLVMDIIDAYNLKLFSKQEIITILTSFFPEQKTLDKIDEVFQMVTNEDERIAYLRSKVIGKLIYDSVEVFVSNEDAILAGNFNSSLIKETPTHTRDTYKKIAQLSFKKIYKSNMVVEIELAAYRILHSLLSEFTKAIVNKGSTYNESILSLIPEQYKSKEKASIYEQTRLILDFISGMTDDYALNLYRTIKGIQLPYTKQIY